VTPTCIIYIEGSKSMASITNLKTFAKTLNLPISYLGCFENLPETTISEKITKARLFNGLTKTELAELLGCDVKSIGGWISNKFTPGHKYAQRLKELFKILI
jgi:DNA-binding XRE family transcriptional regulator